VAHVGEEDTGAIKIEQCMVKHLREYDMIVLQHKHPYSKTLLGTVNIDKIPKRQILISAGDSNTARRFHRMLVS